MHVMYDLVSLLHDLKDLKEIQIQITKLYVIHLYQDEI